MQLTGLHFLLTYQCTFQCDHCFVWGSPRQNGTMTLQNIQFFLNQAKEAGLGSVSFEGGEPFLYYATLLEAVRMAVKMGFTTGIVSNAYWVQDTRDAVEWLRPFKGLINSLTISSDLYHYNEKLSRQAQNATQAANELAISIGMICVAQPEDINAASIMGELPPGEGAVMYRGRAVEKLSTLALKHPWEQFTTCPHENLSSPGRVHLDALGNLHICQGISIGNLFRKSLKEICDEYTPEKHPITGPLFKGGPAELARTYQTAHAGEYADACHLCYDTRLALRAEFPDVLTPGQMYGEMDHPSAA